jgi:hypothetical protein
MAIRRDRTKRSKVLDDSCPSSIDLTAAARLYTLIDTASAGGIESVQNVAGQGANFAGVLVNNPNVGDQAFFRWLGTEEIRAGEAVTAGYSSSGRLRMRHGTRRWRGGSVRILPVAQISEKRLRKEAT